MPSGFDYTENDVNNILQEKELELIGNYISAKNKITIKDKQGYKYYGYFTILKDCKLDKPFTKSNPYTIENIKRWILLNNYENQFDLLSTEYISATEKLTWLCKHCNSEFERDWHYMKKQTTINKICNKCNRKNLTIKQTHFDSKQLFLDDGYIILSEYKGKHKYVILKDSEEYKYKTKYNIYINNNKNILKFHPKNPFTIENIKQWIINSGNSKKVELLSDTYNGQGEHLLWRCLLCGKSFKRSLADMIKESRNKYCSECSRKQQGERRINLEREQEIINDGYKLLKPYKNATSYIDIEDEYGYRYKTTGYSFNRNDSLMRFTSSNPYTINNIRIYLEINNIPIKLLSNNYMDSKELLWWECKCGNKFERCWNGVFSQNQIRCNDCCKKIMKEKGSHSQTFINQEFSKCGYKVLSKYENYDSHLYIMDDLGYKYYTSYGSFQQTHNISIFNKNNPYTIENIKLWIKINNIPIELISTEYIDSKDYLTWRCECGEIFEATWGQVLSTKRYKCTKCSQYQSKIAKSTEDYLDELNLFKVKEYRFIDCKDVLCLPFDFAIFDDKGNLKFVIEVQGQQHYTPSCFKKNYTQQDKIDTYNYIHNHDEIKRSYCNDNNISLLILPYWEFDKTDTYKTSITNFIQKIN
jgi:hypothetical protein